MLKKNGIGGIFVESNIELQENNFLKVVKVFGPDFEHFYTSESKNNIRFRFLNSGFCVQSSLK